MFTFQYFSKKKGKQFPLPLSEKNDWATLNGNEAMVFSNRDKFF